MNHYLVVSAGAKLRELAEHYSPLKKDKIHELVRGIPRAGDAEKKMRDARIKEIMAAWGDKRVSRPSAVKIFELEIFIQSHPEHAGILDDIKSGRRTIKGAHRELLGK